MLHTPRFDPDNGDHRELGIRLVSATVNGTEVLSEIVGDLHEVEAGFRWTRPAGRLYLPRDGDGPWRIRLELTTGPGRGPTPANVRRHRQHRRIEVSQEGSTVVFNLDASAPGTRIVQNTGGVLLEDGAGADRDMLRPEDTLIDRPAELFFGCGNGLAVRTHAGREVGWFDEMYFVYYEDVDLSWSLRSRGWTVRYVPEAIVLHEQGATSSRNPEMVSYYTTRNRVLTLVIHASRPFAMREFLAFLRGSVQVLSQRTRPREERRIRRRATLSVLAHLPHALARRRRIGRDAVVGRRELERLITPRARWEQRGH